MINCDSVKYAYMNKRTGVAMTCGVIILALEEPCLSLTDYIYIFKKLTCSSGFTNLEGSISCQLILRINT